MCFYSCHRIATLFGSGPPSSPPDGLAYIMGRIKPVFVDSAAQIRASVPPHLPSPGHPLHGQEARVTARWLLAYANRKPAVPLHRGATTLLRLVARGRRPLRAREFTA